MVRTKVFVGNLAFSTKEPELAAAFQAAGKVIGANIITRGPRSLGYGFVEMESEEDARKAVELMNKKELNGRQINVEVAKPQLENKEREKPTPQENGGGGGGDAVRPVRRRRPPRRRRPSADEEDKQEVETSEDKGEGEGRRRPRRRNAPNGQRRVAEEAKEESKSTLFVANLPFSLDDDGFAKIVIELGLKPKSAHVVKKRNGRSKGYGFVEFEAEADQKKALDGLNKKSVDGRELSVKIALTEQPNNREETEKPAPQPIEKKVVAAVPPPAEKKTAPPPAEKKTASPAEKKVTPPAEKKTASPAEKVVPPAEKKTESPAKSSAEKK